MSILILPVKLLFVCANAKFISPPSSPLPVPIVRLPTTFNDPEIVCVPPNEPDVIKPV